MSKLIFLGTALFLFSCGPVRFSTKSFEQSSSSSSLLRDVVTSTTVNTNNKLDILLVIDNSNSMLADNQKLAERLSGFVNDLYGYSIDWQLCMTTTSTLRTSSDPDAPAVWGASVVMDSNPANTTPWVLKSGTPNLNQIFVSTINAIGAGWAGTDDERGIKAAWWHLYNGDPRYAGNSGCYRNDAALAMIIISDEDERSIGGFGNDEYYEGEFKALEYDDMPENLISQVRDIFGNSKRFTVNSIIVKPDDTSCLNAQDAEGTKAHYGRIYANASELTGGGITSICEQDYSTNLNYFKNIIQGSMTSLPLQCSPHNNELIPSITLPNGLSSLGSNLEVQGLSAVFTPPLPTGTQVSLRYKCSVN